jgi:AbrB family looped-hinge helix DNA binding protein
MVIETAKMSERGQIIIPKEIREEINAKENTIFLISALNSETIVLKKLDRVKAAQEFWRIANNADKMEDEEITRVIAEVRKERLAKGLR